MELSLAWLESPCGPMLAPVLAALQTQRLVQPSVLDVQIETPLAMDVAHRCELRAYVRLLLALMKLQPRSAPPEALARLLQARPPPPPAPLRGPSAMPPRPRRPRSPRRPPPNSPPPPPA